MSNKTYDRLKVVSLLVGYSIDFVLSLITIWQWPNAAQWTATVSALGVFLGAALLVSTKKYQQDMAEHADDPDEGRG